MSEPLEQPDVTGRAGWTLVQLSELVRRAEELLLDGITLVGPHAHAAMAPDATIELGAVELRRVVAALAECAEIAERLDLLAAGLPRDEIVAAYEDVREAAAADLEHGIVDPSRLLLAARLLDTTRGWGALAGSLTVGDVVAAWDGLTVETLLGRFRGADAALVAGVAAEAGVDPGARLSACEPEQLAALANGLRRHASGQPAS
ncbi:MAG TPA: hypothetical protein VFU94_02750 [Conexibacter sp.]|nr:hypothetical protein [Conexibacter sp.]